MMIPAIIAVRMTETTAVATMYITRLSPVLPLVGATIAGETR